MNSHSVADTQITGGWNVVSTSRPIIKLDSDPIGLTYIGIAIFLDGITGNSAAYGTGDRRHIASRSPANLMANYPASHAAKDGAKSGPSGLLLGLEDLHVTYPPIFNIGALLILRGVLILRRVLGRILGRILCRILILIWIRRCRIGGHRPL